ncbi:MAG: hemerythrin domain-containing protein [Pirellulaceae bacterium]
MSDKNPASGFTLNAAFFQEIKDDHQQLQCVLKRLRELVGNRSAIGNHKREFSALLFDLLDQLAFHFTLEEAYGYFEDAVDRAPRFHVQAGKLRSQHSKLYVMCQEIAEAAAVRITATDAELQTVIDQYLAFDQAFQSHESAELSLIMDAMNLDVGVGD